MVELYVHFWRLSRQKPTRGWTCTLPCSLNQREHSSWDRKKGKTEEIKRWKEAEWVHQTKTKKITSGFSEFEFEFREDRQIYVSISDIQQIYVSHLILRRWNVFFSIYSEGAAVTSNSMHFSLHVSLLQRTGTSWHETRNLLKWLH